ncbi:hypothetical protein V1279_002980 [Bradyrhizobium sp. AZCC 1610]|uniref:hypothetical protein n=1 Tax=Bradyrhizobium sp. AZCC 1610 TaxID=3117020 RepID=UPI002FF052B4
MSLDFRKPLQTRHGYPARLVFDQLHTHVYGPLVFAITHPDGMERIGFRRADGSYPIPDSGDQWDIVYAVKREVVITVEGGMVDVRHLPSDVQVTVIDFDVDGLDVEELSWDQDRACIISEYGPGDQPVT